MPDKDREIDFLICNECNTPCYYFEMEKGALREAQCLVCGNERTELFTLGDDASDVTSDGGD